MALRVLLADESTTIKKVMQLALQDFAVEVKSVQAGIDVLDVARSFQPDLIFVDVLLQKKNGYEVCASIKHDSELRTTPVVLMWSQFMDLDETLARSCGADARLEKPFDVETLRKQVLELVPKTRSQRLAHFLEFSPSLNQDLSSDTSIQAPAKPPVAGAQPPPISKAPAPAPPTSKVPAPAPPTPQPRTQQTPPRPNVDDLPLPSAAASSNWNMEAFDDPMSYGGNPEEEESFTPLELSQDEREASVQLEAETDDATNEDDGWARQDLSQFKLDLPPISVGDGRESFKIDMGEEEFSRSNIDFGAKPPTEAPPARPRRELRSEFTQEPEIDFGNDLTLEAQQINDSEHEMALPLEPLDRLETEEILEIAPVSEVGASGPRSSIELPKAANQMSAEQLERVIRAQSREIIEQVVRKIVPDLATAIIREELERLLEDTAVRESRTKDGKHL